MPQGRAALSGLDLESGLVNNIPVCNADDVPTSTISAAITTVPSLCSRFCYCYATTNTTTTRTPITHSATTAVSSYCYHLILHPNFLATTIASFTTATTTTTVNSAGTTCFYTNDSACAFLCLALCLFFEDDTPELLASDVHIAGAGICDDSAVMKLAVEGPKRVEEMLLTGTAEVSDGFVLAVLKLFYAQYNINLYTHSFITRSA